MAPEYVTKTCYGNYSSLSREYCVLDYSLRIEVPEYDGPFLKPHVSCSIAQVRKEINRLWSNCCLSYAVQVRGKIVYINKIYTHRNITIYFWKTARRNRLQQICSPRTCWERAKYVYIYIVAQRIIFFLACIFFYKVFLSLTGIVQHHVEYITCPSVTAFYTSGYYLLSGWTKPACAIGEVLIAV